jgi:hypothetical protein
MPTAKKATKSKSGPAADPHADAKVRLAETLLAQHRAKGARRPGRPAPAAAERPNPSSPRRSRWPPSRLPPVPRRPRPRRPPRPRKWVAMAATGWAA